MRQKLSAILACSLILALFGFVPAAHAASAATVPNGISTTDLNAIGMTPTLLAQDLAGAGVTVSNVKFTGANAQAGRIHIVDPAVVSFNDGIILSSGDIANVIGPNKSEGITGDMAGSSDPDLNALIANTQTVYPMTFDATVLEFDFVPTANTVYFTYVFGSDEYMEWVNLFNDVFAFYINGTNCATVGTDKSISIDTINANVNSNLYRDNSMWNPPTNPLNIETDGLTVEMICSAPVTANATNHIKLAIADTSDQILDSVVMLKTASFSTTKPESCNDHVDNDDDLAIDMDDSQCSGTTTPPPPGNSGVGISSDKPAFTGNEGEYIKLDASTLGWTPSADTLSTSWTVFGINGLVADCVISPAGHQPIGAGLVPAIAWAVCPEDGEYTARLDGWDVENKGSWDSGVDFFVHNAPPAVSLDTPAMSSTVLVGDQVDVISYVSDGGASDTISCSINWGDGNEAPATYSLADGTCTGSHTYSKAGDTLISVTATDNVGDSSAAATIITVDSGGAMLPQTITWTTALPTSAAYGSSFVINAVGGDSGNALDYTVTGGCTNSGATVTMTSGTTACDIAINQTGDAWYDPATEVTGSVTATKRAVSIKATAATKVAGTSDPTFAYTFTGGTSVLLGDSLGGSLSRTAGETPGTYAINVGTVPTNTNYSVSFTAADLTITGTAPSVTTHPVATTMPAGNLVSFTAAATGNPTPNVQWQVLAIGGTWSNVSGATSTTYSFTTVAADNGKQYRAVFSNGVTPNATSNAATLTVTATPTISAIAPTTVAVGGSIVITGTNFAATTAGNTVTFTGTATSGTVTAASTTSLTVTVPTGATSGTVKVTTSLGNVTSVASLTIVAAPTFTSFAPATIAVGGSVVLTGTNFSTTAANNVVTFTGTATPGTVTAATATSLTVTVPAGATTGKISVTFAGLTRASATNLTVVAAPTITTISRTTAAIGATIVITGTGFSTTAANNVVRIGAVAATVTAPTATSLTITVPATAVTGSLTLTAFGVTITYGTPVTVVAAPTITSVAPTSTSVGSSVTINGTNFSTTAANNTVVFTGTATVATVSSATATALVVVVPTGATTGVIKVTVNGVTVQSASVTIAAPPTVTSFTPTSGPAGTVVTITGTGLTGTTQILFGGKQASLITNTSATSIKGTVPTGATTGTITVKNAVGTVVSTGTFTVTVPAPTITSFTATTGGRGLGITITGTNFTGATSVSVGGVATTAFRMVSATSIIVGVPAGAVTGKVTVTTPGGTATSTANFTVTATATVPTVTKLSVSTGGRGLGVTLTGTNFAGATTVAFNGVSAPFTVLSNTSILVAVPVTTTGTVSVTTAGGTGTSTAIFTYSATASAPTVTSFTPANGSVGGTITITGTNLAGVTAITVGGVSVTSWRVVSATSIQFIVPAGALSGVVSVTTPGGTASSTALFTVI